MRRYSFPSDINVLANAFGKGKAEILLSTSLAVHSLGVFWGWVGVFLLALLDETAKKNNLKRATNLKKNLSHN